QAGDYAGAERRLSRVLAQHPENAEARLVRGEVLRELGRSVEAHAEHVQLRHAFGVTWPRNDLALARCLLDLPQHAHEAVGSARAAAAALPRNLDAARLLFEAELAAGETLQAAESARRLMHLLPPGEQRQAVAERIAKALARAGDTQLRRG